MTNIPNTITNAEVDTTKYDAESRYFDGSKYVYKVHFYGTTDDGVSFDAHAQVMDAHGMKNHRLNACGYSLGAKFTPSWMDSPMFYKDNPVVIGPGMVFFAHMILMNSEAGAAFCLGRTYIIGEKRPEPVSKAPLGMIIR